MATKARATIKDVARAAGASISTVSHVVNRTKNVSPELEQRVNDAITKLGYEPSRAARKRPVDR